MPRGSYSSRGVLGTFWKLPSLRTLLRTLFNCKTHSRPPSENPSENPCPEPFPETSQNPSQNAVLPYGPLGVHPILVTLNFRGSGDSVGKVVGSQDLNSSLFARCSYVLLVFKGLAVGASVSRFLSPKRIMQNHVKSWQIIQNHTLKCLKVPDFVPESAWFCLKLPDFVLWEWLKAPESASCPESESPRTKKHQLVFNERDLWASSVALSGVIRANRFARFARIGWFARIGSSSDPEMGLFGSPPLGLIFGPPALPQTFCPPPVWGQTGGAEGLIKKQNLLATKLLLVAPLDRWAEPTPMSRWIGRHLLLRSLAIKEEIDFNPLCMCSMMSLCVLLLALEL